MSRRVKDMLAGGIATAPGAFGLASFGWWNPYLSLYLVLGSIGLWVTAFVAVGGDQ